MMDTSGFEQRMTLLKEPANSKSVALRFFSVIKDKPKDSKGMTIPGDICAVAYNLALRKSYKWFRHRQKIICLISYGSDSEKVLIITFWILLVVRTLPNKKSPIWEKRNVIKGKTEIIILL